MRTRPLGLTGLEVTELALGTWGLSGDGYGPVPEAEAERTVERALELGLRLFETADVYGEGAMERCLGRVGLPSDAVVVTKLGTDRGAVPPRKCFELSWLRGAVERSQERLGRDQLDVVLLHNPTLEELSAHKPGVFLDELARRGVVRAWGVSAGSAEVGRAAIAAGAQVVQIAYNALSQDVFTGLSGTLSASGAGLLVRSTLAHGLLVGDWTVEQSFAEGDHRRARWSPELLGLRLRQAEVLRTLVGGSASTMRAAALRFVLASGLVTSAVLGPRSAAQLEELVRDAGEAPPYLRETELAELAVRLRAIGVVP